MVVSAVGLVGVTISLITEQKEDLSSIKNSNQDESKKMVEGSNKEYHESGKIVNITIQDSVIMGNLSLNEEE